MNESPVKATVIQHGLPSPQVHLDFARGYVVHEPERVTQVVGILEPADVPVIIEELKRAYERATGVQL